MVMNISGLHPQVHPSITVGQEEHSECVCMQHINQMLEEAPRLLSRCEQRSFLVYKGTKDPVTGKTLTKGAQNSAPSTEMMDN